MKRFFAALLCALIAGTVLAFAACSDGSSEGGEGNGNGGTPQTPVNPDAELPSFFLWRRERDSNPRIVAHQRFSRPPHSTALPSLQKIKLF